MVRAWTVYKTALQVSPRLSLESLTYRHSCTNCILRTPFTGHLALSILLISSNSGLEFFYPRGVYLRHLQTLNNFINHYINAALALPQEELDKTATKDHGYTFLHALAASNRDPKVLRDEIAAVLLAGRDSTAITLSWLFYELGSHPLVVKALREEIFAVVGCSAEPTYEQLKNMKNLQNTLNETLRLYPAVPVNQRTALTDTTLPRGGGVDGLSPIGIPKGTSITYSLLSLHLQAANYEGSDIDPLAFEPERWKTWHPKPWTYLPFNGDYTLTNMFPSPD